MKRDIVEAFRLHALNMLCLSELGEIHAGLGAKLYELYEQTVTEWIMDLLADTTVSQVSVYADAHYVTIVKQQDVDVAESRLISGFIAEQAGRSFQHFRVRLREANKLVSVINCHAPSSIKRKLTVSHRLSYFRAFHSVSDEAMQV